MRDLANLPSLLQSFFTTRLMTQRKASPHTIASYRDTFRLLLQFAQKRLRRAPSQLELENLDASLVDAFLEDLENRRGNGARSRNLRFDGYPVILPLRFARSTGAERNHPTGVGHSKPTAATCTGGFSNPTGDRSPVGGAESNELAGAA
jgi:hypothetical protein